MSFPIAADLVASHNRRAETGHREDYDALGRTLSRRGVDIEAITAAVGKFAVAVPTWGDADATRIAAERM